MFVILWHFEVKPVNQVRFEKVYGIQGPWVRLFRRDVRFRGTQLLHDPSRDSCYFTVDFWDSEMAYRDFLNTHQKAYNDLDASLVELTASERYLVSFECDPAALFRS